MHRARLATAVAVLVLALFAYLTAVMVNSTDTGDIRWTRLVYVYGATETLVVAAAGVVFGREVTKARAERAESRVETTTAELKAGRRDAEIGRALGAAVRSLVTDEPTQDRSVPPASDSGRIGTETLPQEGSDPGTQAVLRQLVRLAKELEAAPPT